MVRQDSQGNTAYGYLASGIDLPLTENRGTVLLLVEQNCGTELQQQMDTTLLTDLVGDGWTYIRAYVSADDSVSDIQALVASYYNADPTNLKAVFIFGSVPIPKSGWMAPDSLIDGPKAIDLKRPFPTDLYYGVMNGTWTDTKNYGKGNVPDDGIYDQNTLTDACPNVANPVALEIGRVDLSNLPTFDDFGDPNLDSELSRLSNYLTKDHNFRTNGNNSTEEYYYYGYPALMEGFVQDNDFPSTTEGFSQGGLRNFSPFFGPDNVLNQDWDNLYYNYYPYLWGYACGPGSYTSVGNTIDEVTTADMLFEDPAIFTMLFGDYCGEWDATDDLLRAELATPNYGLTSAWSGRPNWFFQRMGIGHEIGESAQLTQNNFGANALYQNPGLYAGYLHDCLMGDPTLRMIMVSPPQYVSSLQTADHTITISWYASPDDNVVGYNVYRLNPPNDLTDPDVPPNGPATRINDTLLSANTLSFDDTAPQSGENYYMVRAVTLETRTSSSYYNASEGIWTCTAPLFTPPLTINDSYETLENTVLTTTAANGVLSNDSSAGGDTLTASLAGKPTNGTLVFNSDGSFTYTPNNNYYGKDTFTYKAYDGFAYSRVTTVTLKIDAPPVATNDTYGTAENTALAVKAPGVLGNDTDPENTALTAVCGQWNATWPVDTERERFLQLYPLERVLRYGQLYLPGIRWLCLFQHGRGDLDRGCPTGDRSV